MISSPSDPSKLSACAYPPFDDAHRAKPRRRVGEVAAKGEVAVSTTQTKQQSTIQTTKPSSAHIIVAEPSSISQVLQFRPASSSSSPPPLSALISSKLHTDFDLINELEENWEKFYAHTSDGLVVKITNYPLMISESIISLCKFVTRYQAGIMIGSAACIEGGLSTILNHEHIQSLIGLRERFSSIRDLSGDGEVRTIIAHWFRSFDMKMPHDKDKYKLTVALTNGTHNTLMKLSDELGVGHVDLAKMCMMITLCGQTEVLTEYREEMTLHIDSFWRRACIRAKFTQGMLNDVGL